MNLWHIFPESMLRVNGLLYLPYLAVFLYALVLLMLVKYKEQRAKLLLFLLVTAITNIIIIGRIGPGMGKVLIPLLLLTIMVLPLLCLIAHCLAKNGKNTYIYGIVTIAGWVHGITWFMWIFAHARS